MKILLLQDLGTTGEHKYVSLVYQYQTWPSPGVLRLFSPYIYYYIMFYIYYNLYIIISDISKSVYTH